MSKHASFKLVGLDAVPEQSGAEAAMLEVFTANADKYYTQKMFVQALCKSNPYVNKLLRKLVAAEKLQRVTRGKTHYYCLRK